MTAGRAFYSRVRNRIDSLARRMRAEGRKGSAAIEFAMVAPVFFLL